MYNRYISSTILLLFFTLCAVAQETQKITNNAFNGREEYYVLKADRSVKHGSYLRTNAHGKKIVSGHYSNNMRDSIWSFYDSGHNLFEKYDYTNRKLLYYSADKKEPEKKYRVLIGTTLIDTILEQPPRYIGDPTRLIGENINYPAEAREHNAGGKVMTQFVVYKDGSTGDVSITESLGYGMDEEALRVVSMMKDNWIPGLLNGEPVNVIYTIPVVYRIE